MLALIPWQKFWFDSPAPERMKRLRTAAALSILFSVMIRTLDLSFYYGESGLTHSASLPELMDMRWRFSIFQIFPGMSAVWTGQITLLITLALLAIGIYPRAMAILSLALQISFMHRDLWTIYGADQVSVYLLFYLCFADYRIPGARADLRQSLGSMAYRLCQIQVCIIYFFAGFDKLSGVTWWRGQAVGMIIANSQNPPVDFHWLLAYPGLIATITYLTVVWELAFPFLVWLKPTGRNAVIALGVLIHLGIAFSVGLFSFSAIMISTYALFVL